MIVVDGKLLRGSYQFEDDNPNSDSHPAIQLVSVYLVERGLILEPYEVDRKSNEITTLTKVMDALNVVLSVFALIWIIFLSGWG